MLSLMRNLGAMIGLAAAYAAGGLVAIGLLIATQGVLAGIVVAAVLFAGYLLGALAHAAVAGARPAAFTLTAAVVALAAVGFAALGPRLLGYNTVVLAVAAGVATAGLGALASAIRRPAGRQLVRLGAGLGVIAALAATIAVADGARGPQWWHGGLDGILAAAAALVVVAVVAGWPAAPPGWTGPVIVSGRSRPTLDALFRSACADTRWYPVIPVVGSVVIANAPAVILVLVAWGGAVLHGRDQAEEIQEVLTHPTGVGRLAPSI